MKRPSFISWEQLRVGVVVVIGLVILGVALVRLGRAANLFSPRYTLVTYLQSADGLRVGASVTVAGKLAGTVRDITFLPPGQDTLVNLRLLLELDQQYQEQIRGDSRVRVKTQGLIGDRYIDISPGTIGHAALLEGDTLQAVRGLDFDAILAQASDAVDDVVALAEDLRTLTGGLVRGEGTAGRLLTDRSLYDQLVRTTAQTNALLGRLQSPRGTFGRMIDDPALYQNLVTATASVDSLVRQLNAAEGTLGRLLRDDTLYVRMVGAVASADTLLRQLRTGDGTAARLLNDQQLYDRLNKTVGDLNAVLEDIRRDPSRYTRGLIRVF